MVVVVIIDDDDHAWMQVVMVFGVGGRLGRLAGKLLGSNLKAKKEKRNQSLRFNLLYLP